MNDSTARVLAPVPDLTAVQALAKPEMARVDALIRARLGSDVLLVNQVAEHIVGAGGKRLRPLLVLLAARAAGYAGDQHVNAAAIVEFIHTATLLHDDVVDESRLRRGRATANALWGNSASILVGDFLYSRAFQLMVELDRMRIMQVLADTTNAIAEGEVLQLMHLNNPDVDEPAYFAVIARKTAVLFAAATRLGAILAGLPPAAEEALARYGHDLGMAFQVADDLLDYVADAKVSGKNAGDDLAEGKPTLPIIRALAVAPASERAMIREALEQGSVERLAEILAVVRDCGALAYAEQAAGRHAHAALAGLDALAPSPWRDALATLAAYAIHRDR